MIGNAVHCEEAERIGVDKMSVDDLKKFNKNKKVIKKFAKKYDAFLASDTLIKQIPRLLGPGLTKAGKFPTLVEGGADLTEKMDGVKAARGVCFLGGRRGGAMAGARNVRRGAREHAPFLRRRPSSSR